MSVMFWCCLFSIIHHRTEHRGSVRASYPAAPGLNPALQRLLFFEIFLSFLLSLWIVARDCITFHSCISIITWSADRDCKWADRTITKKQSTPVGRSEELFLEDFPLLRRSRLGMTRPSTAWWSRTTTTTTKIEIRTRTCFIVKSVSVYLRWIKV